MLDTGWMVRAACLDVIDQMWDDSTPTVDALRFCFRCPVRRECARYGLERNYATDAGVLGGLGLYDREKVRDGTVTVEEALSRRLGQLVDADWEDALAEDYVRRMPRLELV